MNLLIDIQRLSFKQFRAFFTKWKIEKDTINDDARILFFDGLIGINSSSKVWVTNFLERKYGFIVNPQDDLIDKHSLKDGDVFLGRDENYLIFTDGNLNLKTNNLDLNCQDININCQDLVLNANSINITCPSITINGIDFSFTGGKLSINGKEVAVVGGDIDILSKKIIISGQ